MSDETITAIEKILTGVDAILRRRLTVIGAEEVDHIIVVIAPDGAGLIRSNFAREKLREMAATLIESAAEMQEKDKLNELFAERILPRLLKPRYRPRSAEAGDRVPRSAS